MSKIRFNKDLANIHEFVLNMEEVSKKFKESFQPIIESQKLTFSSEAFKTLIKLQSNLFKSQQTINTFAIKNKEIEERMSLIGKRLASKYEISEDFKLLYEKLSERLNLEIDETILNEVKVNQIDLQGSLLNELESHVEQFGKGHSSRQGLQITLNNLLQLIMILLMLAQMSDNSVEGSLDKIHSEQQKTNQILKEFEGFSERFETLIDKAEPDYNKLLLVKKEASIRIQPHSKSALIITVFKGQHLDMINSINRWYQVKYFDFETSRVDTGWIYKGNVELRGLENGD